MINKIEWKRIRGGQVRPYADTIYEYEIISEMREEEVKRFCKTFLGACKNEGSCFNGSCGFPFGLEPYCKFEKDEEVENKYNYKICYPYTG